MKKLLVFLLLMVQPICSVWAESAIQKQSATKEITMTTQDAMKLAGDLVERGDLEHANQILTKMPQTHNLALEIERWFLLAQIAQKQGDYESAIKIYRKILDDQPDLARIRFELALCYMKYEYLLLYYR